MSKHKSKIKTRINYNHSKNVHTKGAALKALPILFPKGIPKRILDVGCGTGTWLNAAKELGAKKVYGIDGIKIPEKELLINTAEIHQHDLTKPINLKQKFDVVFCFEVAEHLDPKYSLTLIKTLTKHADKILFSAACPDQPGQNHVNCQWPEYWQNLFNKLGFKCIDAFREKIWDLENVEWWYKQNIFYALKSKEAGKEKRIPKIRHPELDPILKNKIVKNTKKLIENGSEDLFWYFVLPLKALFYKFNRYLKT